MTMEPDRTSKEDIRLAVGPYGPTAPTIPSSKRSRCALSFCLAVTGIACAQGHEEIHIVAREYRFEPAAVRRPIDGPFTLVLVNHELEAHEFTSLLLTDPRVDVLSRPETPPGSERGGLRVPPGGSLRITLQAPPGTYPFQCRIRGHGGMKGAIILL